MYGRKCRTPLNWVEPGQRRYYGIDFVKEAEKQVLIIYKHMEAAQARQKSYAAQVGDFVYLKVSPMKGVNRFGVKRKLAPRYVGPYQIIEKSGKVAYKVQLPPEMRAIFPVFHVSQLKKCLRVPEERVKTGGLKLQSDLSFEAKPMQVLDVKERVTRGKVIKRFRVLWNRQRERDATWERKDYLQVTYPSFYEK